MYQEVPLEITVNGKQHPIELPCSVAELLVQLKLKPTGLAVAVNRQVVPQAHRETWQLKPKDVVEFLTPVGGG